MRTSSPCAGATPTSALTKPSRPSRTASAWSGHCPCGRTAGTARQRGCRRVSPRWPRRACRIQARPSTGAPARRPAALRAGPVPGRDAWRRCPRRGRVYSLQTRRRREVRIRRCAAGRNARCHCPGAGHAAGARPAPARAQRRTLPALLAAAMPVSPPPSSRLAHAAWPPNSSPLTRRMLQEAAMTRELLNTLFVMTPDAYVRLDHDTLKVEAAGAKLAQVPLPAPRLRHAVRQRHDLVPGDAPLRPGGPAVSLMDYGGRFKARVVGPICGNVLLRQAQYEAHRDDGRSLPIARAIVAGKVKNMHQAVSRAAREAKAGGSRPATARLRHVSGVPARVPALTVYHRRRARHRRPGGGPLLRGLRRHDRRPARRVLLSPAHPPPATRPRQRPALVRVRPADDRLHRRLRGRRAGPPVRLPACPAPRSPLARFGFDGGVPALPRGPTGADADQPQARSGPNTSRSAKARAEASC